MRHEIAKLRRQFRCCMDDLSRIDAQSNTLRSNSMPKLGLARKGATRYFPATFGWETSEPNSHSSQFHVTLILCGTHACGAQRAGLMSPLSCQPTTDACFAPGANRNWERPPVPWIGQPRVFDCRTRNAMPGNCWRAGRPNIASSHHSRRLPMRGPSSLLLLSASPPIATMRLTPFQHRAPRRWRRLREDRTNVLWNVVAEKRGRNRSRRRSLPKPRRQDHRHTMTWCVWRCSSQNLRRAIGPRWSANCAPMPGSRS